jgi:hypothetical protein
LNVITEKTKEVFFAVLPITLIVTFLNFTITPLGMHLYLRFLIGAFFIVVGLTVFLLGVDMGVTPIGTRMGTAVAKSNSVAIVIIAGLVLGFAISVAEPDLHILAQQVRMVTANSIGKASIILVVSVGIAFVMALGFVRIVFNIALNKLLTALYFIILMLGIFTPKEFLAIAFDASGATTGAITTPFMLALALGISSLKKDSKSSEEDSFGLVAIASAGAIIAVMVMGILSKTESLEGTLPATDLLSSSLMGPFLENAPVILGEVILALLPVTLIFAIFQKISFKLSKRTVSRIALGIAFSLIGLVLFLTGVNGGFMEVGSIIGNKLALFDNKYYLVGIGFILGFVTILAEPAVYVLTQQIEEVTSGYVRRSLVMGALSLGVGSAVALAMINILSPQIDLWHFLLPGYIISIALAYYVPGLFVGMSFDSGGVASGPMTATFILAFAHGAANAIEGASVLTDGFGVIAMVALSPMIALQILGVFFRIKSPSGRS